MNRLSDYTEDGTYNVFVSFPVSKMFANFFPCIDQKISPPHVTYLNIGPVYKDQLDTVSSILLDRISTLPLQSFNFGSLDYFHQPENSIAHMKVLIHPLVESVRAEIVRDLLDAYIPLNEFPEYKPHATLAYLRPYQVYTERLPQGSWRLGGVEVSGHPYLDWVPFLGGYHDV